MMQNSNEMTIQDWREFAIHQLKSITEVPHIEADALLKKVLLISRAGIISNSRQFISSAHQHQLNKLLQRRMQREPLAYVIEGAEFWSLPLTITPQVLVPRPETELLVECLLKLADEQKGCFSQTDEEIHVADLGTGSGCISLALAKEKPNWKLFAVDISESALALAKKNANDLALNHIQFYLGNWCEGLPSKLFHAIVSNPPYLSESEWKNSQEELHFEPKCALLADLEGLSDFMEIARSAKDYLKPGGFLLLEHGAFQAQAVRQILQRQSFVAIQTIQDLAGHERLTVGQMPW